MAGGAVNRKVIAAAVAVPVAAVAIAVAVLVTGADGPADPAASTTPPTATEPAAAIDEAWNAALASAFAPIGDALIELASTADSHATGDATGAELATVLDRIEPALVAVASAVDSLPEHPDDPLALPLVESAAELYRLSVRSHRASLEVSGDVATQYDHLGRRLRILGDRVFDRARERTSIPFDPGPDVELVRPAEVPDWERLEIAAGPPLEPADPNRPGAVPLEREERRASQPAPAWRRAVDGLDAPGAADVRRAFDDGNALARLARRLVAAAEALRVEPVPDGDRGRADRLALAWLVRADGARAAQLALVSTDLDVSEVIADALVALSDTEAFDAP